MWIIGILGGIVVLVFLLESLVIGNFATGELSVDPLTGKIDKRRYYWYIAVTLITVCYLTVFFKGGYDAYFLKHQNMKHYSDRFLEAGIMTALGFVLVLYKIEKRFQTTERELKDEQQRRIIAEKKVSEYELKAENEAIEKMRKS